ncbi:uncharacterized protein cubi_01074 [Cryptosporidium ubiquitum]|uniref:Uncharacterized protein n=1 Tax=Cryptosporidium ubiquitum TaxID=857276 RepID=A0A1J4MJ59_9CRYT|nr:uncharacterized protein cubi_01074 [Cryptosporidium ubiquitum]OII74230.1 hypothetical protein cubi_01074 [Cryptosporidium ubiquitum]
MNYLYSGDNFGTIKEYNITKILNSDELSTDSITKYSSKPIKRTTFIYTNKFILNEKNQSKNMLIGYSDGKIDIILTPLNNDSNIPIISFIVNGEVIFIHDITLNYPNESEKGNKVIVTITGSKKLYLLRLPQINEGHPYFQSTIDLDVNYEDACSIYTDFIIEKFELPCTNLKCVAYNNTKNCIAFGGYESDIKIIRLDTLELAWSSKNIQKNMLKHRMPIDVTKLTFIQEDPEILLCGTGYGEIRLYAPQLQRRPIINYVIWEEKLPVTSLEIIKKWSKLKSNKNSHGSVFAVGNNKGSALLLKISDTQVDNHKNLNFLMENRGSALNKKNIVPLIRECVPFNISIQQSEKNKLNIRSNHRIEISTIGSFKGIMGGITAMSYFKLNTQGEHRDSIFLAIGGLGRYVYIFEVKKRRLVKKIFTSQKTTFINILE